eukprot:7950996-Karenia_brevis.AAC.1
MMMMTMMVMMMMMMMMMTVIMMTGPVFSMRGTVRFNQGELTAMVGPEGEVIVEGMTESALDGQFRL